MRIFLVVKGDVKAAQFNAAYYDVELVSCEYIPQWDETYCYADVCSFSEVIHWFAAGPHQSPYTKGTCLFYTVRLPSPC